MIKFWLLMLASIMHEELLFCLSSTALPLCSKQWWNINKQT